MGVVVVNMRRLTLQGLIVLAHIQTNQQFTVYGVLTSCHLRRKKMDARADMSGVFIDASNTPLHQQFIARQDSIQMVHLVADTIITHLITIIAQRNGVSEVLRVTELGIPPLTSIARLAM